MFVWYSCDVKSRSVKVRRKVCRGELGLARRRDGGLEARVSVHRGECFMSRLHPQVYGEGAAAVDVGILARADSSYGAANCNCVP